MSTEENDPSPPSLPPDGFGVLFALLMRESTTLGELAERLDLAPEGLEACLRTLAGDRLVEAHRGPDQTAAETAYTATDKGREAFAARLALLRRGARDQE